MTLNYLLPVLQEMPQITRLTLALTCESYIKLLVQPFLNLIHLGILFANGPF